MTNEYDKTAIIGNLKAAGFMEFTGRQDRQCTYNVTLTKPSCNHFRKRMAIRSTYSESVLVALGIQHAMRMRQIISCGLSGSFSIYPHHLKFSEKKMSFNTSFDFLQNSLSKTFLILRTLLQDINENVYWSSRKVPLILVGF